MRPPFAKVILTVAAVSVLVSGCGKPGPSLRDNLTAAAQKAQQQPHRFALTLTTSTHAFAVTGLVEDDARYQASVVIDGTPSWEEVVSDDAVADRFTNSAVLPEFLREGGTKAGLPDIRSELAAGHWVLDPVGAPDLLAGVANTGVGTGQARQLGKDPVLDAVTALEYVRQVLAVQRFRPYNKNDLDYDPATDTFPKPQPGDPLTRYDSIRTDLPSAAQIQGFGGRATLPDVTCFRRMSVYVDKQGAIVRVLEKIDVADRLEELLSNAGLKLPRGLDRATAVDAVVGALNKLRAAQADEPIDVHELDLTISDGAGDRVVLPKLAAKGSLGLLAGRGQVTAAGS